MNVVLPEIPDVEQGLLSCHPGGLSDPKKLNTAGLKNMNKITAFDQYLGGTSYITAFGSTAREAGHHDVSFLRTQVWHDSIGR